MQDEASKAVLERKQRELTEAGRRQKQGMTDLQPMPIPVPVTTTDDAPLEEAVITPSPKEESS
jgi:hypothetical protein